MPKTRISSFAVSEGATLYYVKDEKYKTNYLNIYFTLPLTAENATKTALLARVLKRGSVRYPSMAALNAALDMDYSASLSIGNVKKGERISLSFSLATMKNAFAPSNEDVFGEALDILEDVMLHPLLEGDGIASDIFDSEKRNLKDSILAQINNKAAWSKKRFIESMCSGEAYAVSSEGDLQTLEGVSREELYLFLKNTVARAPISVYFVGSESQQKVLSGVSKLFEGLNRAVEYPKVTEVISDAGELREFEESMDINQGHLWIGFRTGVTYSHPDYLKYVLFNMVLGGDVTGKMFMNLREKMSLCYTCYSTLDSMKGILMAYAGIAPENKEKAIKAFFDELDAIKEGRVSEDELGDAKRSFVNQMKEVSDNPSLIPLWYHLREGADMRDPENDAKEIMKLTLEDVVECASAIKADCIYFLRGEGEKEE